MEIEDAECAILVMSRGGQSYITGRGCDGIEGCRRWIAAYGRSDLTYTPIALLSEPVMVYRKIGDETRLIPTGAGPNEAYPTKDELNHLPTTL